MKYIAHFGDILFATNDSTLVGIRKTAHSKQRTPIFIQKPSKLEFNGKVLHLNRFECGGFIDVTVF